ncbi:protein adenylyltransferase SelO [Pseudopelagicola sp. nBUS_20]|uniref:protein adenylyltransferase SelO n=1 Tax=Pseudopelagicola sp. nBUS_20 TaxID=3395317 RepID=UPI003EBB2624
MDLILPLKNTYGKLPKQLHSAQIPTPVSNPRLIIFNFELADQIGISGTKNENELAQVFSGNVVPHGANPLAQRYAGHQFGHWNPNLGDGRAILLGEANGFDIQLKGSGQTPYSRRGDGRAWLGPVLREYILSEAMHALGLPTTRALAAVETGDTVVRETALPGAVFTRVASSHIRVGTFQALAAAQDKSGLQALFEYSVQRHYPTASSPLEFLRAVIAEQAKLIAHWMAVGFIHGVMNTDNCTISGETIDYGPCAFLDEYNPMKVFSSIDRAGRYAYGNQPHIIVWNMAQLATALVPLMPNQDAAVVDFTSEIHEMPNIIDRHWLSFFRAKIGLISEKKGDKSLITDFLSLMEQSNADFTNSFRSLIKGITKSRFVDSDSFSKWENTWRARLDQEQTDPLETMSTANPALIPRNHQIERMIQAAVNGEENQIHRLMTAYANPYLENPDFTDLMRPPRSEEQVQRTFCGT